MVRELAHIPLDTMERLVEFMGMAEAVQYYLDEASDTGKEMFREIAT